MTTKMMRGLAFLFVAAPLVIGACDGSDDDKDAVTTLDGGFGTDAGSIPDGLPVTADGGMVSDTRPAGDGAVVDAPVRTDVPVTVDAAQTTDVVAGDATADATLAVDTAPVAVCTETVKFSGGNVKTDIVLTKACSPYLIKTDIDVTANGTLTIEPGVTLRFNPGRNISVGYNAAGKLVAAGTAAEPITFTSSASTPGAGDWAGVQLWGNTMNGTSLKYVTMEYCGSEGDACLVGTEVKPGRVTVDHVTFAQVGPGSDAIWQKDKDSNFTITSCTFKNIPTTPTQQYAISVYAPSFTGIDSNNVFNGAMVQLMGGTVATNATWKNINTTVAVTSDLSVQGTATPVLTLAAGSVFKFTRDTELAIGYSDPGALVLAGTAAAPVVLTSLAGTPKAGDWVGITMWNSASVTIKYAEISFAGSNRGAIDINDEDNKLDIQNSKIASSAAYGIRIPCNSTATVVNTGNTFTACANGDVGPGPAGVDCH